MLTFATLGPAGSNHEFVTERYLAFHGLEGANVVLIDHFDDALRLLADGAADFVVQVGSIPLRRIQSRRLISNTAFA